VNQTSAQRKLNRGVEHVEAIRGEARSFENGRAYELRIEPELRSPEEIKYDCFAVEREPVPDHWPLLIGEAIQNLRSSLDHVVYAARGKQFPIFTTPANFR
jgi:hypothetical protein